MRGLLFTLLLLSCTAACAATVYTWVDENGVTHFSDTPSPNAQKIEVDDAQTYSAPAAANASPGTGQAAARTARPPVCAIDSPTAEEAFPDTFSVDGHATFVPALQPDELAVIVLDSAQTSGLVDGDGGFSIAQLDRGAHTISVKVQDPDGQVLCQSAPVTFYVHQPSAIAPAAAGTVPPPGAPVVPGAPTVPMAPGAPTAPGAARH